MSVRHFLAIDPGTRYMGWSHWKYSAKGNGRGEGTAAWRLHECGRWSATGGKAEDQAEEDNDLLRRIRYLAGYFEAAIYRIKPELIVIEEPREFRSVKGAAALASGSVRKLAMLVGYLCCKVDRHAADIELVPAIRWKGNVPKQITIDRVNKRYRTHVAELGETYGKKLDDVYDAIGIGDWVVRKSRLLG